MRFVVRPAERGDLGALVRLYEQLYPEVPRPDDVDDDVVWSAIDATPGRRVLVAESDGQLIGTIDVTVMANLPRRGEPLLLVENLVVDARHRRSGVGRALLAAAESIGAGAGCYKLQLSAADPEAFHFYEALGLEHAGRVYKRYLSA